MNRLQLTQQVIKLSGRYDLVMHDPTNGHDFGDDGINFYLNGGQRLLDLLQDTPKTKAWHYASLQSGNYMLYLQQFRSIDEVWVADNAGRYPVEEKTLKWIRANYSEPVTFANCVNTVNLTTPTSFAINAQPGGEAKQIAIIITDTTASIVAGTITITGTDLNGGVISEAISIAGGAGTYITDRMFATVATVISASITVLGGSGDETITCIYVDEDQLGRPLYYARIPIGIAPGQKGTTATSFLSAGMVDWGQLYQSGGVFTGDEAYEAIILVPGANATFTIEVLARFYSGTLTSDSDTTPWSVNHSYESTLAALACLEASYRNTQGYQDYVNVIQQRLSRIDRDLADDEDVGTNQMQSSWEI